jgi:raffinose/stachyose/melibiose transport system substrate-binding protein
MAAGPATTSGPAVSTEALGGLSAGTPPAEHGRSRGTTMRRSTTTTAGAALTVLLALTACTGTTGGTDDAEGGADGGAVTLRYLIEEQEDADALALLEGRMDEFEAANEGITIDLQQAPLDSMRSVLQTQLRSGEGPDVFRWGSGPSFGGALAEAGLLLDLTDAYEENGWEVYDFAKEQVTLDGKVYGIPGEMETIGVFYNKEVFDNLGLAEPTTLAELDAAAAAAKDAGFVPFAVSDQEGWQGGHLLSMALSSRIGSDRVNALIAGEDSWTSPDVVAALQQWSDWQSSGYLTEFPTSINYDSGTALFLSGEAAMIPNGSWFVDAIVVDADFEAGYIPFPTEDDAGIFTGGLGSGPFVSAQTEHPEEAIAFLDFLASEEHGRWVVENLQLIPSFPVDTEGLDIPPLFTQVLEDTEQLASGEGDFGVNIDVVAEDALNQAMYDGMQGLFTGQSTAQQVAESLQEASQA